MYRLLAGLILGFLLISKTILINERDTRLRLQGKDAGLNGLKFTGFVYDHYPNFKLKKWVSYWMGEKWGKEIFWHPNGNRWIERNYQAGLPTGNFKGWYPNGKVQFLIPYKNGELNGERWTWHPNGQVAEYALYDEGKELAAKSWISDGRPYYNYVHYKGDRIGLKGGEFCKTNPL